MSYKTYKSYLLALIVWRPPNLLPSGGRNQAS